MNKLSNTVPAPEDVVCDLAGTGSRIARAVPMAFVAGAALVPVLRRAAGVDMDSAVAAVSVFLVVTFVLFRLIMLALDRLTRTAGPAQRSEAVPSIIKIVAGFVLAGLVMAFISATLVVSGAAYRNLSLLRWASDIAMTGAKTTALLSLALVVIPLAAIVLTAVCVQLHRDLHRVRDAAIASFEEVAHLVAGEIIHRRPHRFRSRHAH